MTLPYGMFSDPPRSITRLSAEQRSSLEQVLTRQFPVGSPDQDVANLPELRDQERHAMLMWLMVQSARLQTLSRAAENTVSREVDRRLDAANVDLFEFVEEPGAQEAQIRHEARAPYINAHDAGTRPEYAEALNNFLRCFDPSLRLHPTLRAQVEVAFNHQMEMGRISPQVFARVDESGLETLARERYRLDPTTGHFKPEAQGVAEQRGGGFMRTPEREPMPSPSGAVSRRPAGPRPEAAQAEPELRLTAQGELWMNQILGFSRELRSRPGKLKVSDQYQRIKSMPPEERNLLEPFLEALFTKQGHGPVSPAAEGALDAWLTTQRVRLRVHSEASIKRHESATRHLGAGVRLVAAKLTGAQAQSENARFHSEHESANRPEYATAVNNFLRLLHPSVPIDPALKERIAARFIEHAEKEGTISAPVLEMMKCLGGLKNMAEAKWRLDPETNALSAPACIVEGGNQVAIPTPFMPTPPRRR
jgi:hypothetical protein